MQTSAAAPPVSQGFYTTSCSITKKREMLPSMSRISKPGGEASSSVSASPLADGFAVDGADDATVVLTDSPTESSAASDPLPTNALGIMTCPEPRFRTV
eukprot:CAMPEP_0172807490 /NCGR_PEP_ID=MMETSP1075-20121228/7035_1 /TAXON_ID=2916 /ORGANISM="Ceratium fusus, Strain PA161109" /LENGTH=98 /DNA_ID=CAMNT_0013646483 /DNA_START=30 /DNA_END=327 /DNA_ORIENTATION=-